MKTNRHPFLWALCCLSFCLLNPPVQEDPSWNLILTDAVWVTPNIIRIPFTLTGTLITVRARVDTLEGNFFFDTGASNLLLNNRHVGKKSGLVVNDAGGVTGKVQVLGNAKVDTFRMDNLQVVKLKADVVDLSHIEKAKNIDLVGIIGYDVFKDYQVLFDYDASLLVLVRTDSKGNLMEELAGWEYQPLSSFPVNVVGHVATIRLNFGLKTAKTFALDSGAEQNLLSSSSGSRFLKENFEIRKRVKLRGAGAESIEVLSGVLKNALLDSIALTPMFTLMTDLSEINAVYETAVDGILGYEFFVQQPFSINYKKQRLAFYKKPKP
jgi:hypothetical protein